MASDQCEKSSIDIMPEDLAGVDIRDFLKWEQPELIKLAEDVFQNCIFDKIHPPQTPLMHSWIAPGGAYIGQWLWDTMFVVDLLSIIPGTNQIIRDVFQNYWDFQELWNARMPEYAHGMVTCNIMPGKDNVAAWPYSQNPILGWGLERVYKRNGDKQLLRQCLCRIEEFHEWYWRERDVRDVGLVTLGSYNGLVGYARWENFDKECNMDGLSLTEHPGREAGADNGCWYGDICVTGNTAFLVMSEKCIARLAIEMGDVEMAARRKVRIDKATETMQRYMWDEEAGTFLSVKRDTLEKIPVGTIGSWMPLIAGVATDEMAARMAETLKSESWNTPLPVPTVDTKDARFGSDSFWRGDVWVQTNYQIARGLADYGYMELAAEIADKTIANAMKNGISEHYDSITGQKLGVENLGMAGTVVTMMLDGLSGRYWLKLR